MGERCDTILSVTPPSAAGRPEKPGPVRRDASRLHPRADQGHPADGGGRGGQLPALLPPDQAHGRHARDREEGEPVLSEHLHPGRSHAGGVPRDDVRGHNLPAAQGSGRHGEAPPLSQKMMPCPPPESCQRPPFITLPSKDPGKYNIKRQTTAHDTGSTRRI